MSSNNKELVILNGLFKSRNEYAKVHKLNTSSDLSTQAKCLYKGIVQFYDTDVDAQEVDKDCFISYLERTYANKAKDLISLIDYDATIISETNLISELILHKRHEQAIATAAVLMQSSTSVKAKQEAIAKYQEYDDYDITDTEDIGYDVLVGAGVDKVTKAFERENLIPLYPAKLNNLLEYGVPPSTHILIYGVPNVAKTLVAIANACGNIRNGKKVLYCGNEDGEEHFLMRIWSRLLELTKHEILRNPDEYLTQLIEQHGNLNLIYAPMYPGTPKQIEDLVVEYEPEILIVDQIRQLDMGGKVSGDTAQLTMAAKAMRMLTKKYKLVTFSLTQAGKEAYNKLTLEQQDVYMSNVTVAGDCDIMIGVGMSEEYESSMRRRLTLARDKIHGKNHQWVDVKIDPFRSKIISE